jgi:hypothetical protein
MRLTPIEWPAKRFRNGCPIAEKVMLSRWSFQGAADLGQGVQPLGDPMRGLTLTAATGLRAGLVTSHIPSQ